MLQVPLMTLLSRNMPDACAAVLALPFAAPLA